MGRGGSGERGNGLNYVRRVALCYSSRRSRRSSAYVPDSFRALRAISVNYSLGVSSTTTCSIWSLPLPRFYNLIHERMKPYSVNYVAAQDNTLQDTVAPLGRCRNCWAPTMEIICFAVASSLPRQELESRVSFQTDGNDNADAAITCQLTIVAPLVNA